MTTYAITGASGFLGWHVRCRLRAVSPEFTLRCIDRRLLADAHSLASTLEGCDAVIHLAGVNDHESTLAAINVQIAEALVDGLCRVGRSPHLVYANSARAQTASHYGRAKARGAEVLRRWAEAAGATFADILLPNLFGEGGRPRYNSAVATFCDAVITGARVDVNPRGQTELLHAQDAADLLLSEAAARRTVQTRVEGEPTSIPKLYNLICQYHDTYVGTQTVPHLSSRLELGLFNQLRFALFPNAYPVPLAISSDYRGSFFEAVRGTGCSQTSVSTTVPGITRGNHWHLNKIERFLVVRGCARIEVRRVAHDKVHVFDVTGDMPAFIDMPTLHTHSITNVGDDELLTLFWANDHFSPAAPDTFAEPVRLAEVPG